MLNVIFIFGEILTYCFEAQFQMNLGLTIDYQSLLPTQ